MTMGSRGMDEDEAFNRVFDRRQDERLESEMRALYGQAQRSPERNRVAEILRRDRADRGAENARAQARLQVENGDFTNIADTVLPPTPEQLAKGGFRPYHPALTRGTVRTVKTVRRQALMPVQKLILDHTIDFGGFRDCLWYRELYERTGLTGNIGSVDYGREVFAEPQTRAMFADYQTEAQNTFRFIRSRITVANLKLLDPVVLQDVPIWRAARVCGAGWRRAKAVMARAVMELGAAREALSGGH